MAKYVADPVVVMGAGGEPVIGSVLAHGKMMTAMLTLGLTPSKAIEPVYRRTRAPRHGVRVRLWHPFADAKFWISGGYYEWTRLEWIRLWFRAMVGKGRRIPRMIIVQR